MTVKAALVLLPLALLLADCGRKPVPPAASDGFDITLTLSPAAKAKLERIHEKIEVAAYYFGPPNAEGKKQVDEMGQVDLGVGKIQAEPDAAAIHMPGTGFDAGKLKYLNGDPIVLVNVYTARKAATDNLLECSIFEDAIKKAQLAPVAIACKLIYPDPAQGNAQ